MKYLGIDGWRHLMFLIFQMGDFAIIYNKSVNYDSILFNQLESNCRPCSVRMDSGWN